MPRKLLAAVILICLVVALPLVYFIPKLVLNPSGSTSEYTEVRVEATASSSNSAIEEFGGHSYYFYYAPDNPDGSGPYGYVTVKRQDSQAWTYRLRTGINEKYQEIEFKITEIQPGYCILMVKHSP